MNRKHFTHREWHYTGNHPNGQNHVYEDGKAALLKALGLSPSEDAAIELWNLSDGQPHKMGGRLVQITKSRTVSRDSFGYETKTVYSIIG